MASPYPYTALRGRIYTYLYFALRYAASLGYHTNYREQEEKQNHDCTLFPARATLLLVHGN